MRFARYLRYRVWEMLLVSIAASALGFTACSAFYASQPIQAYPAVIAAVCAALVFTLTCIAFNAKTAVLGGIAFGFAAAGALVALYLLGPTDMPLEDVEGNGVITAALLIVCSLLAFLLTRRRFTTVLLLVGGVYLCALVEYLYWHGHVIALSAFALSTVALVVLKGYERSLAQAGTGQLSFGSVAGAGMALALVALLAGAGVYVFAIAPLDPPHHVVKLFVEHRRVEEVEIRGTGASASETGGEQGNLGNDEAQDTDQQVAENPVDTVVDGLRNLMGMNDEQLGDEGSTTALTNRQLLALLLAALIILVIIAAILLKKLARRLRFNRMMASGNDQAARSLYLFFLDRFRKLKITRPETLSLTEFAAEFAPQFSAFERGAFESEGAESGFSEITGLYVGAVYGEQEVTDAQLGKFTAYYRSFYKNSRRHVGRLRYAFKFFTL